jgi:hypothetical protein
MKKIILLSCAFLISYCSFAQRDSSSGKSEMKMVKWQVLTYYAFGAIVGSNIGGDDDSYDAILIGGEGGVGGPILSLGQQLALAAELEYAMRGSKYHDTYVDGKVVLAYLMLPLFLHYNFTRGFYGEAGLQPGVLLSAKDKYDDNNDNYKDAVNSFDLGVLGGVGYVFNQKVGVGLRYSLGVTNMNKADNAKDHNSAIALRLMWFFGK